MDMELSKEALVLADYYTRRALEVNRIEGEISSAEASMGKMYEILGMPFEGAGYVSLVPEPVSLEELLNDEERLRGRVSQINDAYDNAVKIRERQQKVLAEAERKVKEVARLDGLTHLYRKDVFLALLDKEIQRKNSPHRRTEDAEGILGLIIMDTFSPLLPTHTNRTLYIRIIYLGAILSGVLLAAEERGSLQ